jgi:hypothetical protein
MIAQGSTGQVLVRSGLDPILAVASCLIVRLPLQHRINPGGQADSIRGAVPMG